MKKIIFYTVLLFCFTFKFSEGQNNYPKKYITLPAGEQYEASWLWELFYGAHWRDLWTTPIKVEILDLQKFAGGLTPIKRGGGFQTKSLRLKGNDGHIWKFRSLEKDPSKLLNEELKNSLAADILQDQISSSNPAAPLVVSPILDSTGIMQAKPYLVYMPDSELLGKFRKEFGGGLGYMEIHPDVEEDEGIGFEGAEKVKGTFKLFHYLEKHRSQKVSSPDFLKARLVDLFLGDWDRHTDQWKWARYNTNGNELWYPIPRDRDQAFAKFDGILPWVAAYLIPQFNNFGYSYPNIEHLTWNGRFLDRHFLTELTKTQWDSIAVFVLARLTDKTIEDAVNKLPPEYYGKASEELISKLKKRRDNLFELANEYYYLVNDVIDIYCSNKKDFVTINRLNNDMTVVAVYKRKGNNAHGDPYYFKVIDNNLTDEIRVFLMGNDDKIILKGKVDKSPLVRIISGKGKDEIVDSSRVNGYFLSITPFPKAENKTLVYDNGKKTKIDFGSGTSYYDDKEKKPLNDEERYRPLQRDRRGEWLTIPMLSYNNDDGFIVGISPAYTKYNFRMIPYDYKLNFSGSFATKPGEVHLAFDGKFNSIIKGTTVGLQGIFSTLIFTKYFGYGNETTFSSDLDDDNYYKLNNRIIGIVPSIEFHLFKKSSFTFSASYYRTNFDLINDTLLTNFPRGKYGLGEFNAANVSGRVLIDIRDNLTNPYSGFYFEGSGQYYFKLFNVETAYFRAVFDVRSYITFHTFTNITLALRGGGGRVWGDYPFQSAIFLGGSGNLRGFSRERFSGDASLFGQSELRIELGKIRLLLPATLGVFGFSESGRVFVDGSSSKKWHPSYGGGISLSYLQRGFNLSAALANSSERLVFIFGFSMAY